MSIFSRGIYDNVRTRVIVINDGNMLLLEPHLPGDGWQLPGGGLEPNESLAECAQREVWEETGLQVLAGRIAFLRELVVPKYCQLEDDDGQPAYRLEVYVYAHPLAPGQEPRPERPGAQAPQWVPLEEIPLLPLWPKELKSLAAAMAADHNPQGVPSFVTNLESPHLPGPEGIVFA